MQNSVKSHFTSFATSSEENALTCSFNCFSHNQRTSIHILGEIFEFALRILNWFEKRFLFRWMLSSVLSFEWRMTSKPCIAGTRNECAMLTQWNSFSCDFHDLVSRSVKNKRGGTDIEWSCDVRFIISSYGNEPPTIDPEVYTISTMKFFH